MTTVSRNTIDNENAEELYDYGQRDYEIMHWFYGSRDTLGMHYGFWEKDTPTWWDAQQNENRYIQRKLELTPGDAVLDAGCGIGGTVIPLAREYQVSIQAITISKNQVREARERAKQMGVDSLVTFTQQDFHHTNFPDRSFDKIYAVESGNYADPPARFLAEMFRILRPGGKLLLLDAYLAKPMQKYTPQEQDQFHRFCDAWSIPDPHTLEHWVHEAGEIGFEIVQTEDVRQKIMKTASRAGFIARLVRPFYVIGYRLHWLSGARYRNMVASVLQEPLFKGKLLDYHTVLLRKK